MRKIWNLAWKLLLITAVAGLALGFTNAFTKDAIAAQQRAEAERARRRVLPAAQSFELISEGENGMDSIYRGLDENGAGVGVVGTITTRGYGGEIEITVGLDENNTLAGINVGGANFAETAGLGAKTKEPAFMEQFAGLNPPLVLKQDVQPVTGATISSTAVTDAVNEASAVLAGLNG